MRVLVTDGMDAGAVEKLRKSGHEIVEQFYEPEELGAALRDFDAVIIRSATKIKEPQIDAAKGSQLKLIVRAGVGVDNIAVKYAEAAGIKVMNTPRASSNAVAELALALLFAFIGRTLKVNNVLGFFTLLIAHITFNLPYVILSVLPKLAQMDRDLRDAAMDLGCTPAQAFFKVILYEIMPGVISGALMSFTMSLDDFVISYFVYGPNFITLPVEIYNYTKKPLHP